MKNNKQMLDSMVKTTRMGQTGIRAVLRCRPEPPLEQALKQQLHSYDDLEDEAQTLADHRGWTLKKPDSMAQRMIEHMTWMKIPKRNRTSKMADMMIQGNTQGMISSLRDMHSYCGADRQIIALNEKLVSCEIDNIQQMKPFL